jgi:hypothetical protein
MIVLFFVLISASNVVGWWKPKPGLSWQWQLQGTIDTSKDVDVYDIDLFDAPQSKIDQLHSLGRAVICYTSSQYENFRDDTNQFPNSALGKNQDGWPGERYVDVKNQQVRNIWLARIQKAKSKKCDAIEWVIFCCFGFGNFFNDLYCFSFYL